MSLKKFEDRLAYLAIGMAGLKSAIADMELKNICYMAYKDCSKQWFEIK